MPPSRQLGIGCPVLPIEKYDPVETAEPIATITPEAVPSVTEVDSQSATSSPAEQTSADPEAEEKREAEIAPAPNTVNQSAQDVSVAAALCEEAAAPAAQRVAFVAEEKPTPENLLAFHGLKQQPFDVTPDPAYLYWTRSHREALASLSQGIEHFRGFMTLIAEPGMGKTTLLNRLMEEVGDFATVVFVFQTQCNSNELLGFILNELEVDHTGMDLVAKHRALNQALLNEMLRGRRFVLIVDEAQNLQPSVLETIRLLSDFETTHSKLIQIVLAGQPQLADTLLASGLEQFSQRITVLATLSALSVAETAEYVEHRLRTAGWNGKPLFAPEAVALVAEASEGVPRRINHLCFDALLLAYQRRQEIVDALIIKEVAGKVNLNSVARPAQTHAASARPAVSPELVDTAHLARALMAALAEDTKPRIVATAIEKPQAKSGCVVTGTLTEKVRCHSSDKKHEYRIQVSLERDPVSGLPIAARYYCCIFYISEEQASTLSLGKPVRIKLEQE